MNTYRAILEQPIPENLEFTGTQPNLPELKINHPSIKILKHELGETVLQILSNSKPEAFDLVVDNCQGFSVLSLDEI